MPAPKPISKDMCLSAMDKTKSVKAAARYLNCSYHHLKRYMKLYVDEKSGKTLFELHKNQQGKGIPKFLKSKGKEPALLDIIEGKIDASSFSAEKLKYRLTTEGYLEECCNKCGFREHRVLDHKIPLVLNFKDKNLTNYNLDNIEFLCYNCHFLYVGDVYSKKDLIKLEENTSVTKTTDAVDMQLDDYHLQRLRELGLDGENPIDDDDPYNLVSYS
jgi:hypothetical protein